jgi:hypothetical protein
MPQVKSVLGHVSVETAQRKRICYRHRHGKAAHDIVKDEDCLVVREGDGASRNYCLDAADDILTKAQADLEHLKTALGL